MEELVSYGHNIVSTADKLQRRSVVDIIEEVRNPSDEMKQLVDMLRRVKSIDVRQYNNMKKRLPYVVGGLFSPDFRKSENFASISHFVVDIDKVLEYGGNVMEIRNRIIGDRRVEACFISPSGDGLKVFFHLKEPCKDAGLFTAFYRKFLEAMDRQYDLREMLDRRTVDVTRACFMSVDATAVYCPNHDVVRMSDFLDLSVQDPIAVNGLKTQKGSQLAVPPVMVPGGADPDAEAMKHIRELLGQRRSALPVQRSVHVPDVINEIMSDLAAHVSSYGLELYEQVDIQYGKKLRIRLGLKKAELNLFYGRRGFSVVGQNKSGTNQELCDIAVGVVREFVDMVG